jgi:hypothetical protein
MLGLLQLAELNLDAELFTLTPPAVLGPGPDWLPYSGIGCWGKAGAPGQPPGLARSCRAEPESCATLSPYSNLREH